MVPLLRDWCPPLILSVTNCPILVWRCLQQPSQGSRETKQKALWYCPVLNTPIDQRNIFVGVTAVIVRFKNLLDGKTILFSGTKNKDYI